MNIYKHFVQSNSSFHDGFTCCWINCFRHKSHQLFLKWTSCPTKGAEEEQCHWISHEHLLCFSCKLCQTKSVSKVYFTFKWKDQFLGGKLYFCTLQFKIMFILFYFCCRDIVTSFLFTATICQESLENIAHFSFWRLCYSKYVFSLHFLPAVQIFIKQLQYESFMTVLQSPELY